MAEGLGGRLLGEINRGTLEDLLSDLRKLHFKEASVKKARLGVLELDEIWSRHGGKLEINGRYLPLLYHIVSVSVSPPNNGAIVVVDADGRFDITRLSCSFEDLNHVYVFRPKREELRATVEGIEDYMLYNEHGSMGRELIAVVVSGNSNQAGGDILGGWRGWLRVESEKADVPGFGLGMSLEEALKERSDRQVAVEGSGWRGRSDWGQFKWLQ